MTLQQIWYHGLTTLNMPLLVAASYTIYLLQCPIPFVKTALYFLTCYCGVRPYLLQCHTPYLLQRPIPYICYSVIYPYLRQRSYSLNHFRGISHICCNVTSPHLIQHHIPCVSHSASYTKCVTYSDIYHVCHIQRHIPCVSHAA